MNEEQHDPTARRSPTIGKLAAALSKAQGQARNLEEGEKNRGLGYSFVSIGQITKAARKCLADNGLAVIADTVNTTTRLDGKWTWITLTLDITLAHESGEYMVVTFVNEGGDNRDKAYNKAYTAALKQALMKLLLISSKVDDDSDFDSPEKGARENQPTPGAREKPKPTEKQIAIGKLSEQLKGTGEIGKTWLGAFVKTNGGTQLSNLDAKAITEAALWLADFEETEKLPALYADVELMEKEASQEEE